MRHSRLIAPILAVGLFAGAAGEAHAYKHGLTRVRIVTIVQKYAPKANVEQVLHAMGNRVGYCQHAPDLCRMIGGERAMQRISARVWAMAGRGASKAEMRAAISRALAAAASANVQRQVRPGTKSRSPILWWFTCPYAQSGNQRIHLCTAGIKSNNVLFRIPWIDIALELYWQIGVATAGSTCQKRPWHWGNSNRPCKTNGPRWWGPNKYSTVQITGPGNAVTNSNAVIAVKSIMRFSFNQPLSPPCVTITAKKWVPLLTKSIQVC